MSGVNVQNQIATGKVVGLPSVSHEVHYETYRNTLFNLFSFEGENTKTVEAFKTVGGISGAVIDKRPLSKGDRAIVPSVKDIEGQFSYGSSKAVMTNPLQYGALEYWVNTFTSPIVPLRGEDEKRAMENFIDDKNDINRRALQNLMVAGLDWSLIQTFFNGASWNLLATKGNGGKQIQIGEQGMGGVPQMPRHIWYADGTIDTMRILDWETIHSGGYSQAGWNLAAQNIIQQVSGYSQADNVAGKLTKNKLDMLRLFAQESGFSAAKVISSVNDNILVVEPRVAMALRREIAKDLIVDVRTTLSELNLFGFKDAFVYFGTLVLAHDYMRIARPKVNSALTVPVFGSGETFDKKYVPSANDNVSVGMFLSKSSLSYTDLGRIETKFSEDEFGDEDGIKQKIAMGSVRNDFWQVSVDGAQVDFRDGGACYNDTSALVIFQMPNV